MRHAAGRKETLMIRIRMLRFSIGMIERNLKNHADDESAHKALKADVEKSTRGYFNKTIAELETIAISDMERLDSSRQIVAKVHGRDVTRGELSAAFDRIKNTEHWKKDIDAWINVSDFDLVNEAAIFFAGSPLTVIGTHEGNLIRVKGAGYYKMIGA